MFQHAIRCGLVLVLALSPAFAQSKRLVCKRTASAAVKPAPELDYPCGGENDWDEKQLKDPARMAALNRLMTEMSTLADPAWWATSVDELNACDFKGEPGTFTEDERQQFADGDYWVWLFGNSQIRLLLLPDPCYQTQYSGSNAFILYRKGKEVTVTQVLDGYFSRADKSVSLNFGKLNNELVIEVATGSGGLNPTLTNYYFVIDPVTNRAVPKKLFASKNGPTNEITSAMLFNDVPGNASPLNIIRGQAFARSFSVYTDNGRTLARRIRRWNGQIYR
jgi:hypothetical protein